MGRKVTSQPPTRTKLEIPTTEARRRLEQSIANGEAIKAKIGSSEAETQYEAWNEYNSELLKQLFSDDEQSTSYYHSSGSMAIFADVGYGIPPRNTAEYLNNELNFLRSLLGRLDLFPAPNQISALTAAGHRHPTAIEKLEKLMDRFHRVAVQLQNRHGSRPTLSISDEYDVQDLMRALLSLEFDDVRAEETTPSYAGGNSRMDFLLKSEQIVVEAKCTRAGLGVRQVGEELAIDIVKYKAHSDCKTLFCFVYDPSHRLTNPGALENDLTTTKHGLPTILRVRPKLS